MSQSLNSFHLESQDAVDLIGKRFPVVKAKDCNLKHKMPKQTFILVNLVGGRVSYLYFEVESLAHMLNI